MAQNIPISMATVSVAIEIGGYVIKKPSIGRSFDLVSAVGGRKLEGCSVWLRTVDDTRTCLV